MIRAPDDDEVEYVPIPMNRAMRAWLVEVANACHQCHPADIASAILRDVMVDDMSEHAEPGALAYPTTFN